MAPTRPETMINQNEADAICDDVSKLVANVERVVPR